MNRPAPARDTAVLRRATFWAAAAIAAAACIAYADSFRGPFLFDDTLSIRENPTIRHLWPLGGPLDPPRGQGQTVEGRPVLNLSFALNYAISGLDVWSYHAANLLIHALAGLALFGILRRTLRRLDFGESESLGLGFAAALLWTVHPLQTESVTYVVQRAESLMGLFYFATLYSFIRGAEGGSARWFAASLAACLLGMATKEVMISAPLIVFLYDRTFVAGSFAAAWRQRGRIHLLLASTMALVILLAISAGTRGGTSGFSAPVSPWAYWATQLPAVVRYLTLAIWPHPLLFDYGTQWVRSWEEVVIPGLADAALAWAAIALFFRPERRLRALGFAGLFFFAILAPTSVMPGTRQTMAEHRMYLPLAAVLTVLVAAAGSFLDSRIADSRLRRRVSFLCVGSLAAAAMAMTLIRNRVYDSDLTLYADTAEKCPDNGYARYNLAKALDESGHPADSLPQYAAAIRLGPVLAEAHYNYGNALSELGRREEAAEEYERALAIRPSFAKARYNLGNTLVGLGRREEAAEQYSRVVEENPDDLEARDNLGAVLLDLRRPAEAAAQFEEVLRSHPDVFEAHFNLGTAYYLEGRKQEAAIQFEAALRLRPEDPLVRARLDAALAP